MKRIVITGLVLLSSLFTFSAMAQMSAEDAEKAAEARHAVFELLSFSNGPLGNMARRRMDFDKDQAIQSAERVAMLAALIPDLFVADTRGSGIESRASDLIWDNKDEFDNLANDLIAGANAAIDILNSQGEAGVRQAIGQIGPKCGACHDRFRLD